MNLNLTLLVYNIKIIVRGPGFNMTCQFCYDRPVVRATGHNGEMVPVNCPVCATTATPDLQIVANNAQVRHNSKVLTSGGKSVRRHL